MFIGVKKFHLRTYGVLPVNTSGNAFQVTTNHLFGVVSLIPLCSQRSP